MSLGEKIKEFGLKKFGSLKAFAEAVDKSPPDLSQYLGPNARRDPGAPLLKKLYDLGCDLNWLFADAGDKNTEKKVTYEDSTIKVLRIKVDSLETENKQLKKSIQIIAKNLPDV